MPNYKYQWPASAISEKEMAVLYKAKLITRTPITKLISLAIREAYFSKQEPAVYAALKE